MHGLFSTKSEIWNVWVDLDLISNLQDILSWDNNKSYLSSISNGEGYSEPLIPEPHGDINLWTLPTTVTQQGECNHELQLAMRKAEDIHEELKRNMHLEHLI